MGAIIPVYIHQIETLLPEHAYPQAFARERMQRWLPTARARRLAGAIYDRSGIETRHSVVSDFQEGAVPSLFREDTGGRLIEPSTQERNTAFAEASRRMSVQCARRLLAATEGGFEAAAVTHVVTVSCTGFYNPGPDYDIVRGLGLSDGVERYNLGFMGCYAAFPALKMARQFCQADPRAVVMVVCIEFCSLHLQIREAPDALLANAIFADGVGAALISARAPRQGRAALALEHFQSTLLPEGQGDMAWSIGDHGFDIRLSSYVPGIIGAAIGGIVAKALAAGGAIAALIDLWAVHPGGRAILDKIETELALRPEQVAAARETLRTCGNMSSATILFVLQNILVHTPPDEAPSICAMAFGPGLTVELALLRLTPAGVDAAPPRAPREALV